MAFHDIERNITFVVKGEGAANLWETERSFTEKTACDNRPERKRVISRGCKVETGEER